MLNDDKYQTLLWHCFGEQSAYSFLMVHWIMPNSKDPWKIMWLWPVTHYLMPGHITAFVNAPLLPVNYSLVVACSVI